MKTGPLHLLIADDDNDDRDLFCEAVASVDPAIACTTAEDGRQALKALSDPAAGRPDLIFLDINMPVMNGWEVLKSLKNDERLRDIPVIIYTTSSGENERNKASELGALCFVTKPYSFQAITNMIEGVISDLRSNELSGTCVKIHKALMASE
jgi:CheY-like chemotaxis protein